MCLLRLFLTNGPLCKTWIKLTDAQSSAIGRKGGGAGGLACTRAMTPDQLSARGKAGGRAGTGEKKVAAGRAAAATLTPAQRRANARKAARIQIAAGTQMNQEEEVRSLRDVEHPRLHREVA
jgi:hypothetical protein